LFEYAINKLLFYNQFKQLYYIIVIYKDHYHHFFFLLPQCPKYVFKCKTIFYLISLLNSFFDNTFYKSNILLIYIIIHNNYGNMKHNNIVTSHINNNQ